MEVEEEIGQILLGDTKEMQVRVRSEIKKCTIQRMHTFWFTVVMISNIYIWWCNSPQELWCMILPVLMSDWNLMCRFWVLACSLQRIIPIISTMNFIYLLRGRWMHTKECTHPATVKWAIQYNKIIICE